MSRPREFDADLALHQCMEVFWAKGFHSTSYEDLTRATQVKKQSLYGVFKNKRELFLQSLALYRERNLSILEKRIAEETLPIRQLEAICEAALYPDEEARLRGCLIINASQEFGSEDADVNRQIGQMMERTEAMIEQAIRAGQAEGTITSRLGSRELAAYLGNAINGAKMMEKSGIPREEICGVMRTTIALIEETKRDPSDI
ncbi:TetR/AcrR family transcriptional regulator [Saccharibacillus alkalitolerans]|uniref:TetR/AcrR family transcriptional regulator n=1 Tax=Saccharibacillus alkalitolerans TaxID=2705290 RepID=A0ABX0F6T7_9BACL|nr:TetR/AcrR family transcriptional regulator [Saccharibacillus alkalitolerans]NGZ75254.1 TetR/AcrR family transcriptional regulator [Saccharibacillus alkalitolerans]